MLSEHHHSRLIYHSGWRLASLPTCKIFPSASILSQWSQQIGCLLNKFHMTKLDYCIFQALTCKQAENIATISQCSGYNDRARTDLGVFTIFKCLYRVYLSPGSVYFIYWSTLFYWGFFVFAFAYSLVSIYGASEKVILQALQRNNTHLDTKLSDSLGPSSSFYKEPTFQFTTSKEWHQIGNNLILVRVTKLF